MLSIFPISQINLILDSSVLFFWGKKEIDLKQLRSSNMRFENQFNRAEILQALLSQSELFSGKMPGKDQGRN